ncbi:MAG TPA: ABC transporter substrate-binding protein [Methanothrix sp.]|nr:ABC transporter substrate-binding protein [Methanothrix sp.]
MRRHQYVIGIILIIAAAFSGCVDEGKEGTKTVKIAALQSLTGDLGTYGSPMTDAMNLAVKEANENGGVLGSQIDLLVEDDQTSEIPAVDAANKLVKVDRVPAIIGSTGSGPSSAILSITSGSEVLQISSSNTGVEFTDYPDNDFYFRTCPSDALQGEAMARLALDSGYGTASTLVLNNPYGIGFEEVFVEAFENDGGEVVESVRYDPAQTIFDSEVERVTEKDPDVVMLVSYPQTGSIILRTAYEKGAFGDEVAWLLSEGLTDENLAEMTGKDEAGRYIVAGLTGTMPDPTVAGPAYEDFKQKYAQEYGREPSIYCSNSYDAGALVILAMEQGGEASGSAIRDNIRSVANPPGTEVTDIGEALELIRRGEEINYQGASGEITFDDNGDVCGRYATWSIAEDGSIQAGEPIEME